MSNKRPLWLEKPTTRHIILIGLLWGSGLLLAILSIIEHGIAAIFAVQNIFIMAMQIFATIIYFTIIKNYYRLIKNKKQNNGLYILLIFCFLYLQLP